MKKFLSIFTFQFTVVIAAAVLFSSCHIASEVPEVEENDKAYEAYGLLTIPSSGFTKEDVRTEVMLVSDKLLDIYMFEVKFATLMPVTIDMVISGVEYTRTADEIHFCGDGIVPTAGNKPYEKYTVTDLVGRITADSICLSNVYGDTPAVYAGARKK